MARTPSTMTLQLSQKAPAFRLPAVRDGREVSLTELSDAPALLVMFICNHCPFVVHVCQQLTQLATDYERRGVAIVAISSNDVENYPDDAPSKMVEFATANGWRFPYLYDEDQAVAKDYHAACTPDFFVFDGDQRLAYRGQLDDSRPGNDLPVTGADLRAALDAVLTGADVSEHQRPSIGCNIKWKEGNAPAYFG